MHAYDRIPLKCSISAFKYAKYAMTKMKIGSMTRTFSVKRVINPVMNPHINPEFRSCAHEKGEINE